MTVFGGDAQQLRLARQPGAFVGQSLRLDSAVQVLQFVLRRAEKVLKRVDLLPHLAKFVLFCLQPTVRVRPLAGELGLELHFLLAGVPTIVGDDVAGPIPPARGFHSNRGEVPFECRPPVGFLCEPLDEFRLARRRDSDSGGGAVLHLLMRRRGVGQPLLQCALGGSVFCAGRVEPRLERGELRCSLRQF